MAPAHAGAVEIGVAHGAGGIGEPCVLPEERQGVELVDLAVPFSAEPRAVAEAVILERQRRQREHGAEEILLPEVRGAAEGAEVRLVELLIESAGVELALERAAAEDRDAGGDRVRDLAAAAKVQEGASALRAGLRELHRAQRRHGDHRIADAAVDVAVVAAADLDEAGRGGGVARFLRADRVHEAVDRGLHGRGRVFARHRVEFFSRAHQLA